MKYARILALVGLGLVLAGCGQQVDGRALAAESPRPPSTTREDSTPPHAPVPRSVVPAGEQFDPCTLPDEAVDATGKWNMTRSPAPASVGGCMWNSADFSTSLNIYIEDDVLITDLDSNSSVVDLRRVRVGDATFDIFALGGVGGDTITQTCFGQTGTVAGGVMLNAFKTDRSPSGDGDSCDVLAEVVLTLAPYLPAPA